MGISCVIPAFNAAQTIAATVTSLIEAGSAEEVLVVDDGSEDATAAIAERAGARVLRLERNRGKGGALEAGFESARGDLLLMVDADTGSTAGEAFQLLGALRTGSADMVVGVLPRAAGRGGFGAVRATASLLIRVAAGFRSRAPLSGQRALTREVFEAVRPFARRFGVDSLLTARSVRGGFRVVEVDVAMSHDHRGRSRAGFAHRARQGADLLLAFVPLLLERQRDRVRREAVTPEPPD